MSFAALPLSALQDRRLGLTDLKILGSVASFASPSKPIAWPSRKAIGARCGIASESRISKHLHRLQDLGWLSIQPRQGSNLYRILQGPQMPTDAPLEPCTPPCIGAVHPVVHAEQNSEQTNLSSPSPLAMATSATTPQEATTAAAAAAARQQHQERQEERQRQREREREQRQQRHQERQERREQRREQRNAERAQRSEMAQNAVQRVLDAFQAHCGVTYPNSGAIAQKVASAIERHGEETLVRVIRHRGQTFRFPLALLRDDMIESIHAELQRPAPPATSHQEERPKERRIYGVPLSVIEREARPGESLEDAGLRIYEQRRNSTLRA